MKRNQNSEFLRQKVAGVSLSVYIFLKCAVIGLCFGKVSHLWRCQVVSTGRGGGFYSVSQFHIELIHNHKYPNGLINFISSSIFQENNFPQWI